MALFDIFIDKAARKAVQGIASNTIVDLPPFVQGDTPTFRITILDRSPSYPLGIPYVAIPTAGLTLQVALGTRVGGATTYFAQQFTWVPDPGGAPNWSAQFALNTAGINTLLGNDTSDQAWFEVKYLSGGLPTTVMDELVTVQAAVIKPGVLVVPPGLTAISAEEVNQAFLRKSNNGFTLISPDGSKQAFLYLGNDGAFHVDPIS